MAQRTVLCQLKDWQRISVAICLSLQEEREPKACFGCDACSRRCAECRKKQPVCPELDLCKNCLEKALSKEGFLTDDRSQGFSWRICESCCRRMVYYAVYGLCLHCSAREFAQISPALTEIAVEVPETGSNGYAPPEEARKPEVPLLVDASDLSALNDVEQTIIVLHHRESYSLGKICHILQLSERMVRQLHENAVLKLKKQEP